MRKEKKTHKGLIELRRNSETKIQSIKEEISGMEQMDVASLVHELRVHQAELETQNEELQRAQKEIEESRSRYADLYDFAPVGYLTIQSNGIILEANLPAAILLGYDRKNIISKPLTVFVVRNDINTLHTHIRNVLEDNKSHTCELKLLKKDGNEFYAGLESAAVREYPGVTDQCRISFTDITEKKAAEEKLKSALQENRLLLKEIHHRVKNNMQIISSLIDLQSSNITDIKTKEIFLSLIGRINAMALIHEKLYKTEDINRINMKEYIREIVPLFYQLYNNKYSGKINILTDIDAIFMDLSQSIPLSLIINELVTNSMEHAFHDSPKGEILIKLKKGEKNYTLIVSDNGVSIPDAFDINTSDTLGLKLVQGLTSQLRGEINIERDNGTRFILNFKM